MTKPDAREAIEDATAPDAESLDALVNTARALFENGPSLIEAELAFQKARASFVFVRAKTILGLAVLALALLFFVLMALVVGLLLALAPLIGPWGALAAVVGALLALTGLCALGIVRRIGTVRKALRAPAQNTSKGDTA